MEEIRDLVTAYLPGYPVDRVRLLGAGTDHSAYEVNGDLVVRFDRGPDGPAAVAREARLLTAVAEISPVAVPRPAFTAPEQGCLAYHKLPGRPVLELPPGWRAEHRERLGATVGGLLAALHAAPPDRFAALVEPDDTPLVEWLAEAAGHYAAVATHIADAHRCAVEAFLAAAPPDDIDRLVFSHNDLGVEHILVDQASGTVTGVIDWSDAALTDPAYDFGLLYRDLGPTGLAAAIARYPDHDPALPERALFYARCALLEDLAYGLEPGLEPGREAYAENGRTALTWSFR